LRDGISLARPQNLLSGILITVTGVVWSPGEKTFRSKMPSTEYNKFLDWLAYIYIARIKEAIKMQKYKYKWKPLSVSYMTYKRRHNLSLNIWEATGHMQNSLEVFKRGKYKAVGFKEGKYYPNSRLSINKIARYVEFGGKRLPPRPLFRTLYSYMSRHIDDFYRMYIQEHSLAQKLDNTPKTKVVSGIKSQKRSKIKDKQKDENIGLNNSNDNKKRGGKKDG
jgi:hypothetical protein